MGRCIRVIVGVSVVFVTCLVTVATSEDDGEGQRIYATSECLNDDNCAEGERCDVAASECFVVDGGPAD